MNGKKNIIFIIGILALVAAAYFIGMGQNTDPKRINELRMENERLESAVFAERNARMAVYGNLERYKDSLTQIRSEKAELTEDLDSIQIYHGEKITTVRKFSYDQRDSVLAARYPEPLGTRVENDPNN